MATKEEEKWFLPEQLLTPEKLAEADEAQKELARRINSPFAHKTAADIQRFNAGVLIAETEKMLEAMPLKKLATATREQYAEALAETGNFHKAAEITKDKHRRKLYKELWRAVWKDDEDACKCRHQEVAGGHKANNLFAESQVWSLKHNREMSVIKCSNCGHRNVRLLPESIRREREIRKRNIALVSGKSHQEAKQILSQLHKK